jgi:cysteine desulfurase
MIYLDNNSTTQIHSEVLKVVNCYLEHHWGNPSSSYSFGAKEKDAIEKARESVGCLVNAEPSEIIFTSCATESSNIAIRSAIEYNFDKRHIITSATEHSSILEICRNLETKGYEITFLGVDGNGMINIEELENTINKNTCLVSLMWANNETGVIYPIEEISKICKRELVLFHCDAAQAVGKIPVDLNKIHIDYLSLSGHKMYAPKGIGALFVKQGTPVSPLMIGGGQEHGVRGGTYNTPYIAGLGKAAELAYEQIKTYDKRIKKLRDYFEDKVSELIPDVYYNGKAALRLPNTSNIGILGIDSDIILNYLDQHEVYISSGSACTSDAISPSHVIQAMKDYDRANEALRISLSIESTKKNIDMLINTMIKAAIVLK